jgi:mevalonate kinase
MARAFGKVILLGEHAVVYGVPALSVGISRGAHARAVPSERSTLRIGERSAELGDGSEIARGLEALLGALDARELAIEVNLELPAGCGLGASAAIGVASARAVLELTEPTVTPSFERVFGAAMAWEQVFHGNPSGVDAAASTRGGCIQYSKSAGVELVALGRALPLVIAVAGPPASTREMVESVARLKERRPEIVQKTLDGILSLVKNARLCLESGDSPGLGQLMNLNQMLLSGLHVSTEGIERACALARDAGALGAKLTGAGGGGSVVALADLDPEPVLRAWRNEGFECFATEVSASEGASP